MNQCDHCKSRLKDGEGISPPTSEARPTSGLFCHEPCYNAAGYQMRMAKASVTKLPRLLDDEDK